MAAITKNPNSAGANALRWSLTDLRFPCVHQGKIFEPKEAILTFQDSVVALCFKRSQKSEEIQFQQTHNPKELRASLTENCRGANLNKIVFCLKEIFEPATINRFIDQHAYEEIDTSKRASIVREARRLIDIQILIAGQGHVLYCPVSIVVFFESEQEMETAISFLTRLAREDQIVHFRKLPGEAYALYLTLRMRYCLEKTANDILPILHHLYGKVAVDRILQHHSEYHF